MSAWSEVFLGIIAIATLATAVVQVVVLVAAAMLARRLQRLTEHVESRLEPVFAQLDAIGREASRATVLASAQIERVDGMITELVASLDQTLRTVQSAVTAPARQGAALMAGARAIFDALRDGRRARSRQRGEEEDALFI